MNVRVNTVRGVITAESGASYLHETVLPLLRQQSGYKGGMTSIDRADAMVGLISLWEDASALEASEGVAAPSRAKAVAMVGGEVSVEAFEQVVGEIGNPRPAKGCLVRFVNFETEPARTDEGVAFFKDSMLPAIKGASGFRAVRHLINRTTGGGLTVVIVSDGQALSATGVIFQERRSAGEAHGIRFGEITQREVVVVDKL